MRNTVKRVICMLLAAGLLFTCASSDIAQAAKKAKLKTKKVTMVVGEKKKIIIKNKNKKASYGFTSSSKTKAEVSKSGVIKAKKAGKVNITVKETYKKKTIKLGKVKVTVKSKKSENNTENNIENQIQATQAPVQPTQSAVQTQEDAVPTMPAEQPTAEPEETNSPVSSADEMEPIAQYLEDTNYDVPEGFDRQIPENEGTVEDITYDSTVIKEGAVIQRKAKVVLPKGYTEDKKYPVVYLNHGIFGNETSLYGDHVQNVIWNAIANGDAEEMIAVFPNCCANETGNDNGLGFNVEHYAAYNNFLNDLQECLMPYINEHYSTLTAREYTAIGGFSMGGRVTLHIGFTLQDTFRYIGAFCPAPGIFDFTDYGVTDVGLFTKETFTLQDKYMDDTLVMIVKGGADTVVKQFPMDYHNALVDNGVPHIFYEVPGGGHDGGVYKPGMYNFFRRIFHKKA